MLKSDQLDGSNRRTCLDQQAVRSLVFSLRKEDQGRRSAISASFERWRSTGSLKTGVPVNYRLQAAK